MHDPILQSFLAWRKSVLLLVALVFIPVTVFKIIDFSGSTENLPETIKGLLTLKLVGDVGFAIAIWFVLPMWVKWQRQRRTLLVLWIIYFSLPFLLYLYPWASALPTTNPQEALFGGVLFSLAAVMSLAPKAVSLLPGVLRGSIVVKLLLPGSSAPGWLIAIAAPIYAVFFYIILTMPYQVIGNGFFVAAIITFVIAQLWMMRTGIRLARPESREVAARLISNGRLGFWFFNGIGAVTLLIAMADFAEKLSISFAGVADMFLSFAGNVWLLTVIASDLLLANLHRASETAKDTTTHAAQLEYLENIKHFAPPGRSTDPMSGPPS